MFVWFSKIEILNIFFQNYSLEYDIYVWIVIDRIGIQWLTDDGV